MAGWKENEMGEKLLFAWEFALIFQENIFNLLETESCSTFFWQQLGVDLSGFSR